MKFPEKDSLYILQICYGKSKNAAQAHKKMYAVYGEDALPEEIT